MINLIGTVEWKSDKVLIGNRIFLFCFGEKCMSGRIESFQKTDILNEFNIWVEFIKPDYFQDNYVIDNSFTINEASSILAKGKVKDLI